MTSEELLKYYRTGANLTQAEFAEVMGVPFRTYQDLEAGKTTVRPVHLNAARWGLIVLASKSPLGRGFLPLEVEKIVVDAARDQSEIKKS